MNFISVLSFVTLQYFNVDGVIGGCISEKKCEDYRNQFPQSSEVFNDNSKDAMPEEFPFMARIVNSTGHYQNGILISEKFVLATSYNFVAEYVILGNLDAAKNETHSRYFEVSEEFTHPHYRSDLSFDLKLLMLKDSVEFNEFIQPACLLQTEPTIPHQLMEIGWSNTNQRDNTILHKVKLDYVSDSMCQKLKFIAHQDKFMEKIDEQIIFCAISEEGDRDMCNGLPFSVLLNRNSDSSTSNVVIGFALSNTGCYDTYPTVCLRISASLSWIESVVWSDEIRIEIRSTTTNSLEQTTEAIKDVDTTTISSSTITLHSTRKNLFDEKVIVINVITIAIISLISCIVVACCQMKRTRNHQEINLSIQFGPVPEDNRVIVK